MMGVLADKTKTRFGKYRPYFLFVPALLTVVVVLLFSCPNLSDTGKIIWTGVFYIGYGMLRTAIEIPCNALINAVTNQETERQKMISAYSLVMGIFTTITTSFALSAVSLFGGENTAKGYMIVVGFAGVLMTVSCLICFFSTEEKYIVETERIPFIQQMKNLINVKGLVTTVIIWLGGYIAYNIMMGSSVYYVMYCLCRPDLISLYMMIVSVSGLIGILAMIPIFMRLFHSVKKGFMVSQICTIACNAVCLLGSKSLPVIFIFSGLASLFATMFMVFGSMLMTELSDMTYYQTGRTMNGTIAALKGFTNKCGIAASSGIISAVLAATGYVSNAIGQEPQATVTGITLVRFLCPLILTGIVAIALIFYPITDEIKKNFKDLYNKS